MRIRLLIALCFLFILSNSLFAKNSGLQSLTTKLPNDTLIAEKRQSIVKLITSGNEERIKKYFREVSASELLKIDSGTIAKAFIKLKASDKVSRTLWILEEVKNRSSEIREYVYKELGRIDYKRPVMVLRHLVNNYFTNYVEPIDSLKMRVDALQRRMNK